MPGHACLNLITIKQEPDLQRKLEIAADAGYVAVGLWHDELRALEERGTKLAEVGKWLADLGLKVPEMCFIGGWMYAGAERKAVLYEEFRWKFDQAQQLGCHCVCACAAVEAGDLQQASADYRELCELADGFDLTPAIEFIWPAKQVRDVKTAWEVVRLADHPRGSVLFDTYHHHIAGAPTNDLRAVPAGKIAVVHVNDAPDVPREQLNDSHRVFCGRGVMPLGDIFGTLRDIGYTGYFSLELFNQEYWDQPADKTAREGNETLAALLAGAGYQ